MVFNIRGLKVLGAAIAVVSSVGSAQALTGTCDSGNGGGNKYVQLTSVAANDSNNVICQIGNPDYSGPVFEETFFGEVFKLAFKSTGFNLVKEKGDDTVTFDTFDSSTVPGTWELNVFPSNVDKIVIGIKQGTTYAGFLVDTTSGTWATGNDSTRLKSEYSHVDIWYTTTMAVVPLPATLPLLAFGVGAFGLVRRRRKIAK